MMLWPPLSCLCPMRAWLLELWQCHTLKPSFDWSPSTANRKEDLMISLHVRLVFIGHWSMFRMRLWWCNWCCTCKVLFCSQGSDQWQTNNWSCDQSLMVFAKQRNKNWKKMQWKPSKLYENYTFWIW